MNNGLQTHQRSTRIADPRRQRSRTVGSLRRRIEKVNFMDDELLEPADLCRAAADKLDSVANRDAPIVFPGWDDDHAPTDERSRSETISRVAAAVPARMLPRLAGLVPTEAELG